MKLLPPSPRRTLLLVVAVWLAGTAALWALLPPASPYPLPHQPWQNDEPEGFLDDGASLLTRPTDGSKSLRVWDVVAGTLIASHPLDDEEKWQGANSLVIAPKWTGEKWLPSRILFLDLRTGQELCRHTSKFARLQGRLTPDGRLAVIAETSGRQSSLIAVEAGTGRTLHRLDGYDISTWMTADCCRVAAFRYDADPPGKERAETVVWEPATDRVVARLQAPADKDHPQPEQFSPDGRRLLDTTGRVWDTTTGRPCCALTCPPPQNERCRRFDADGNGVFVLRESPVGVALCWFDARTGEEDLSRRIPWLKATDVDCYFVDGHDAKAELFAIGSHGESRAASVSGCRGCRGSARTSTPTGCRCMTSPASTGPPADSWRWRRCRNH